MIRNIRFYEANYTNGYHELKFSKSKLDKLEVAKIVLSRDYYPQTAIVPIGVENYADAIILNKDKYEDKYLVVGYIIGDTLFIDSIAFTGRTIPLVVIDVARELAKNSEFIEARKRMFRDVVMKLELDSEDTERIIKALENAVEREAKKFYKAITRYIERVEELKNELHDTVEENSILLRENEELKDELHKLHNIVEELKRKLYECEKLSSEENRDDEDRIVTLF